MKPTKEWLMTSITVLALGVTALLIFAKHQSPGGATVGKTETNPVPLTQEMNVITEDIVAGQGAQATNGAQLTVNYLGTLSDGTKFDSSYDRHEPFKFVLGAGQVIKGWDQGLLGMKVGGKRRLTIPPELGYGSRGAGTIPPNSTLIFEVELLGVN